MRISSRQRRCLQALAQQGEWPALSGEFGWRDTIVVGACDWRADTRSLLASLADLGLVADESTTTVGRPMASADRAVSLRARRYAITDAGRAALK